MESKISGHQIVNNSFWKFCETTGVQVIQILLSIIIARLLSPSDFGVMAIVLVSINFVNIFVNSGINAFLVYTNKITKDDFFTGIVFNLFLSGLLSLLLYLGAEPISRYFTMPSLTDYIYFMLLVIPFNSISSIYTAYAVKKSLFKSLFLRNLIAAPVSGLIGVIMAFYHFGVWALVVQQVSYSFLLMVVVIFSIKIESEGSYRFSFGRLKPMLSFGGFTLLSTFIAFVSDNIADTIIGKKINSEQLGYYNKGNRFPQLIASSVNNVISTVMFPAFVTYREDMTELKDKCRKAYIILSYTMFPILCGLAICAKPFILFALTEKWLSCVPVLQLICIYFCSMPYLQTISQLYLAIGKVHFRMWGEIVKMVFTITFLFAFIQYGINAVAFSRIIVALLMILYTLLLNKILFNFPISEFFKDIAKPVLLTLLMCLVIYPLILLHISPLFIVLLQIITGAGTYVLLLKIFKIKEYSYIKNMVLRRK